MRKVHELKVWPEYFQAIIDNKKKFELRKNDRGFQVGDTLVLKEFEPGGSKFSGREAEVKVTYAIYGPAWGLPADICVLSIEKSKPAAENEGE